jgi:hypothetical protein
MQTINRVTQHAIERYMERTGSKKMNRVVKKLLSASEAALAIGKNQYYHRGIIYVVVDGTVITTYKPKGKEQTDAVYNALHPAKNQRLDAESSD